jgi:3-deoxy-manno-octulosonate cytidylyltransferase (CMP-KDO synthetase)
MLRIVVPARIGSSRLPDKMIQRIGEKMLVEHALAAVIAAAPRGQVYLATDSPFIAAAAEGKCHGVITSANCRSGTDRCAEVADIYKFSEEDVIVNVQADMPFIRPRHLEGFFDAARKGGNWDMLTAFCDHRMVSVRLDGFDRVAMPCHVGLYAYTRAALRRFAALPTSPGEAELRLEQMRALENGFAIAYHALPEMPFEVNTPQDLAAAQHIAECLR